MNSQCGDVHALPLLRASPLPRFADTSCTSPSLVFSLPGALLYFSNSCTIAGPEGLPPQRGLCEDLRTFDVSTLITLAPSFGGGWGRMMASVAMFTFPPSEALCTVSLSLTSLPPANPQLFPALQVGVIWAQNYVWYVGLELQDVSQVPASYPSAQSCGFPKG